MAAYLISFFHPSYVLDDVQWLLDCNNNGGLASLIGVEIQLGSVTFATPDVSLWSGRY
jgi:hypothetical protein